MLHNFLESGAYNATFWFILAVIAAILLRWRPRNHRFMFGAVALLLLIGTAGNLFLSLYRGYSVPRDALQDIISAKEFLAGRPLYPDDMTPRINEALAREGPRPSLLEPWPALRQREKDQLNEMLTSHWVQAHPPFMTLFTAPFVYCFGILGTQIAFLVIALASVALTVYLIRSELFPHVPGRAVAVAVTAVVGWDSLLTVLRGGQTGLLLGALLTAAWFLLRRRRPVWAGIAVGLAVSVKLVPGLILLVLVMRHRRAFVSALTTIVSIAMLVLAMTSIQDFRDYVATSRGVVNEYGVFSGNVSLLGDIARGERHLLKAVDPDNKASDLDDIAQGLRNRGVEAPDARTIWLIAGAALVLAFAWFLRRRPDATCEKSAVDLQFALAMTLMPLLSPVAWDHYLVYLILPFAVLASRIAAECRMNAASVNPRRQWLCLMGLILLFATPDSAFHWLNALLGSAGLWGVGVWLVLDLRTAGLLVLVFWLARKMARLSQQEAPKSVILGDDAAIRRDRLFAIQESGQL